MIGMHLAVAPVGDLVRLAVPWNQGLTLLILEDHQGLPAGGAVNAEPGDVVGPAPVLLPDIGQVPEVAALEEALPGVGHAALDLRLVFGVADPGRVGDEAAALGVFQESPGEGGMQRVRSGHRRRAIVDHQVAGDAAEESPGLLQAGDDVLQLLTEGGPDEAVPGVGQHYDQQGHPAASASIRIVDQAQPAEVLHHPRSGVLHAYRGLAAPSPVAPGHEGLQGRIRHPAAPPRKQLLERVSCSRSPVSHW